MINIYEQDFSHDEVKIIGTRDSLIELKKIIEEALDKKLSSSLFFNSEGEGFYTEVHCFSDEEMKKSNPSYVYRMLIKEGFN